MTIKIHLIRLLLLLLYVTGSKSEDYVPTNHFMHGHLSGIPSTCEPIKIELCMGVGYNETVMPVGHVGHNSQEDTEALLRTFFPLIQYNCSAQLKLFLCSAYVPMCSPLMQRCQDDLCTEKVSQPIGPCRSLCEQVRSGCQPVLNGFGFTWPASLNCDLFHPENNHQNMCIPGESSPGQTSGSGSSSNSAPSSSSGSPTSWKPQLKESHENFATFSPHPSFDNPYVFTSGPILRTPAISGDNLKGDCGTKISSRGECFIRCQGGSGLFTQNEKDHASRYAFIWALFSFLLTLIVVVLSTTIARTLTSPAERPILYIGVCQIFYSIGVLIGSRSAPCVFDKITGFDLLAKGSLVTSSCSLVFLLTYFFGMASALWWVSLCLSWLLSLNKSVANSLETREWSLYHLASWVTASVLTCIILLKSGVDADELTGICGVGYQNPHLLLYFMLIPMATCLGTGLLFLLTGFCLRLRHKGLDYEFVSRVPSFMNLQQKRLTEKSKTTWNRVLVISLVHLIPLFTQVGVLTYELSSRQKDGGEGRSNRPNLQLYLLKINMNLISGFTTGVWILSLYSCKSWLLKLCRWRSHFSGQKHSTSLPPCTATEGSTNTSFLPHHSHGHGHDMGRSLPPLPNSCPFPNSSSPTRHHYHHHHHGDSNYEIRTETWRRGETIV